MSADAAAAGRVPLLLGAIFAVLFYLAAAVLLLGVAARVARYARTPAPLVIPTTPAPTTHAGVIARMFREVVFFESLFKGSKWSWLFGWLFHFGMLVALARHLRYFTEPVWSWVVMIQWIGGYAGIAMFLGLGGLWLRRVLVDRIRYISAPSDHLMLALLLAIAGSGLVMKYGEHTDIVSLKAFTLGLIFFDWQPLPADPPLLVHLSLVVILMLIFPFSKLLHAPGVFFSPTRNMRDNPREHRHLAPWAGNLPDRADGTDGA
ncbi:MAG: respiratory nitrate reductase subunit gamma [Arenicellales bacterium]|nr:respiratory nitrate reductase subunit gamma [Arenicellales bacterium]MDP6792363.1 respiratory nitrate reductase subunit gamma [Arenicellales bacterium]MDP6919274.1 respiratory nitrate reductase subunit gamma [Arenicellales bacterium]